MTVSGEVIHFVHIYSSKTISYYLQLMYSYVIPNMARRYMQWKFIY